MTDALDKKIAAHLAETRGPSVTPQSIEAIIASTTYHRLTPRLTVAVLELANGFSVTGESASAAPENYDQEIGERIAYENAVRKIWPLEGYLLKTRLSVLGDQAAEARIQQLDDELVDAAGLSLTAHELASIAYAATSRLNHLVGHDALPEWEGAPDSVTASMANLVAEFLEGRTDAANLGERLARGIANALKPCVDMTTVDAAKAKPAA